MSVNLAIGGVPGTPVTTDLTTSEADIFAPAANGNPLVFAFSISVVNYTGSAVVAELYWNDGTTSKMFWRKSVAANTTEVVSDYVIPLLPGATSGQTVAKKLRALAGSNTAIRTTVFYTTSIPQRTMPAQ